MSGNKMSLDKAIEICKVTFTHVIIVIKKLPYSFKIVYKKIKYDTCIYIAD